MPAKTKGIPYERSQPYDKPASPGPRLGDIPDDATTTPTHDQQVSIHTPSNFYLHEVLNQCGFNVGPT